MPYTEGYVEPRSLDLNPENESLPVLTSHRSTQIASSFLEDSRDSWFDRNSLFSFASVLPEQTGVSRAGQKVDPGIAALMLAVLNDAVLCIQKGEHARDRRTRLLARQAEEWVESTESAHPFSFISICTVLGLTPGYIRLGLKKWKRNAPTTAVRKVRYSVRPQSRIAQAA